MNATNDEEIARLRGIIQHINMVEANCNKIAMKLQHEDFSLALRLVQLGRIHDASKFNSYEFLNLHKDSPNFKDALIIHHNANPHHPEHWAGGIQAMSPIYIAEMVCDCHARGQEFGTNTRSWFEETATKKYNFSMEDSTGLLIKKYLDLLLTPSFS